MAVSDYAIPWSPPDLTSGLSMLARSLQARRANRRADENTKTQRMFADAQLRRMDSETQRQIAEYNDKQNAITRKMDADKIEFMKSIPFLKNNPLFIPMAAHYGIPVTEVDDPGQPAQSAPSAAPTTNPLLAAVPTPQMPVEPEPQALAFPEAGVDAISGGGVPVAQDHAAVAPMTPTGYAGGGMDALTDEQRQVMAENALVSDRVTLPSETPPSRMVTLTEADVPPFTADELAPDAAPTQAPMATPQTPPQPTVMQGAQAAPSAPMPRNKLFRATIGGQSYDIGGQSPSTGLGEKYDALYARYLQEPGGEKVAFSKVLAAWEHEQSSIAAGQRAAGAATAKDTRQEDQQKFLEEFAGKFQGTFEQKAELRRELARLMNQGKMAAAGSTLSPELSRLLGMVEEGAPLSEVSAAGAKANIPSKAYMGPASQVVRTAAVAEGAGQKREGLEATGPGIPPGSMWKNPQAATKGAQQVQRFHRVEDRLKALIADVETHGERIDFDSKEHVRRMSLAEAAAAALRPYNELSSTDASMAAERAILGPAGAFGHGWILGADLKTLKHILSEAQSQQQVNLKTLLRTGGGSRLAPALGGPSRGEGAPSDAGVKWVKIPARYAGEARYRGKTEVSVDADGNITGSR